MDILSFELGRKKAGGGAPSGGLLPDMSGIQYFYDFTGLTEGGDIEVPNALETVAPIALYGATVEDNGVTLTGNANNSWGYLDTGITGDLTLYTVITCPSPWGEHIIDFGNSDGRWDISHSIYAYTSVADIPPRLYEDNSVDYFRNITLRYGYAVLALIMDTRTASLIGLCNNGYTYNQIPSIYDQSGSEYNDGKLYLCATQASRKQSSGLNIRMLAIGNTGQSPAEIANNLAYMQRQYVDKYAET